jgi:hypothetical protein
MRVTKHIASRAAMRPRLQYLKIEAEDARRYSMFSGSGMRVLRHDAHRLKQQRRIRETLAR